MSGIARFWEAQRRRNDERYAGAEAPAELVVTGVERDSTGKVTLARGTIGGEGDFTVPMLGREAAAGEHLLVRYPKGQPATGVLEYVRHLASDQAGAGIVATNPNLPAPTFADPWYATTVEGSPGSIVARFTVLFNAVGAKYQPSGYTVSYRVSGGVWADVPVPHTGGLQSCRLPAGFAPGAVIDVKLRARYNWNASESVESETRSQQVALDTASPGTATGLQVDNTSPGALILTATGATDPSFFGTWEYRVATDALGGGAQTFRSPGQVTFAGPPGDYYAKVTPISKSGVSGTPFPAGGYAGPYTIPSYAGLDTTPPPAFAAAPTLAARTVQLADGSVRAFLKVTLPASYVFPPDYARTIVRLLETTSGNYQFWTIDSAATEIEQAIGFGTWQVDAVGEDVAGNRQASFGPRATVVIAEPGLPANPADPVCVGTGLAILVTYAMPAGALRVEIERSTDNLGAGAVSLGTFGGTRHLDLLATDANTVVLPSYWYRIRGGNAAGVGGWSNRVQGTVLALHGSYLVADSVTAREIAANTITANEIQAGSITGDRIKAGDVGADRLNITAERGRNYLVNPSMELDADGDGNPDGWFAGVSGGTWEWRTQYGDAYHGARSWLMQFKRTAGVGSLGWCDGYQDVAAAPGQVWTLSAWASPFSYQSGSADGFAVVLVFYNGATYLGETSSAYIKPAGWQRLSVTATAPAGTTTVRAMLRGWSDPNRAAGGASVGALWDAVQLERGAILTDFDPRHANGRGWTMDVQTIVGRDASGVMQTYLDTDGTIRSGSRNVLLNKDGVTVYGAANQTDVQLKRDGSGRGILQAGDIAISPVSGLVVPVTAGGQVISVPFTAGGVKDHFLRPVTNALLPGGTCLCWVGNSMAWVSLADVDWKTGNTVTSYVSVSGGTLTTSSTITAKGPINAQGGIAAPAYVGNAAMPYARGPLGVRQAATLATAAGSFQWMQDWELLTAGTNWLSLSLFAYRQTNSIPGSDWSGSNFVLRGDIDNAGATSGWLKLGWYDVTPWWSLGGGVYTGLGDLYRGTDNIIKTTLPFSKSSGTFEIPHPDPAKFRTHNLRHSFVETDSRGDNLYRYRVAVEAGGSGPYAADFPLPDWWRHLNVLADDAAAGDRAAQVWVSPVRHFGRGWGEVAPDGREVSVRVDEPGEYNVLVMATRGDRYAREGFEGTGGVEPPIRPEQVQGREEAMAR